ncbi:cation transporter [Microbacterium paraoxydans]|uniref:cation transporter n=1 Tax=Microbacterium paraoxydans TaxID=199592 RepID=UPI003013D21D
MRAHPDLPPAQQDTLRRAIRYEWFTLAFLAVAITGVYLVMGSSQAMKAAWIEDLLSLAPPIAFLVAVRIIAKPPTAKYPYGFFRSVGVAHLVAGVALFAMGAFLLVDSVIGLVSGDRPPIGSVQVFGHVIWSGWLMMGMMALTIPLPIYFGRVKMRLAKDLHNKVLYADADMNKADWMTAAGSIVGVGGIGLGLWWADAAAATFIAGSILWDGWRNTRAAITDLMDTRATTFDDEKPHPDSHAVLDHLRTLPWVRDVAVRTRDQGQFFHVEAFIVPVGDALPSLADLDRARQECHELDWKLVDVVLVLVPELADHLTRREDEDEDEASSAQVRPSPHP